MNRFKKKIIIVSLVFVVIATVAAQVIRYPSYEYYGEVLSVDEFLKLVEAETPLNCTPVSDKAYGIDETSIDYVCFNTQKEVDAYLAAKQDQIAQENPVSKLAPSQLDSNRVKLLSNHWALYANSPYLPPHLGDVHNGTSCHSASQGIWSAWRDGTPNNLTLHRYNNCTGNPSYSFSGPISACVFAWPLSCGGSLGASVP